MPAHSWPVWAAGFAAWCALCALLALWWWVPSQPYEVHLATPMAVNPATGYERHRWHRGETFGVRYHTRILRDCPALYERWLTRADGLAYGPAHLGGAHHGHYRPSNDTTGRQFIASITLPQAMQPGEYAYQVRTIARCSPLRATVEESPPVLIDVR